MLQEQGMIMVYLVNNKPFGRRLALLICSAQTIKNRVGMEAKNLPLFLNP